MANIRKRGAARVRRPPWSVLLLGGASGTGKTTLAEQVSRRWGVSCLQVDDLRLAIQRSEAPEPPALRFFEETSDVWRLPAALLRDAMIAVGEALTPVVEGVIEKHLAQDKPVVVEGDGILPAIMDRPAVRDGSDGQRVRAVFVIEPREEQVYANLVARGREHGVPSDEELRAEARAKWLYGRWLAEEARGRGLAVLDPRPWETLPRRIATLLS